MAILFGGDSGVREDSFRGFVDGISQKATEFANDIKSIHNNLVGTEFPIHQPAESVYVDDGFQNVPGTVFTGAPNVGNIDDVQTRRITTQAPDATVYIKKRVFWSLRNEHETLFSDPGEKLFLRASKLLFERKCSQIAAYEAMTKLDRFISEEVEYDVTRIDALIQAIEGFKEKRNELEASLVSDLNVGLAGETDEEAVTALINTFSEQLLALQQSDAAIEDIDTTAEALRELQGRARQGRNAIHTSWVVNTESNIDIEKTGRGTGVIELTLVDSIQTSLSLNREDNGSFSLSIQDPYNLMSIRSEDIELAINSANLEGIDTDDFDLTRGPQQILQEARSKEEDLRRERNSRFGLGSGGSPLTGASNPEIIFEVNPSSMAPNKVTGRVPSIAEPFTRNTFNLALAQLPLEEQLTYTEQGLVEKIFDLLHKYVDAIANISISNPVLEPTKNTEYARRQMRLHYLGKSIVQPMDGIHVYLRGNTARDNAIIGPLSSLLNSSPFIQSFANGEAAQGLTDTMLKEEMRQFGISNKISIDLYRSLRSSSLLRNAGMHVFGGLVSSVGESYNASQGTYTLNVSGESNMKWLDLSRVNTTPSAHQVQGVLEDPLTPLDIEVDKGTGLIIGNPKFNDENISRLAAGILFYKDGVRVGEKVTEKNMPQDTKDFGSESKPVLKHAPGISYKWKQGVIVATRNVNLRSALSGPGDRFAELRRDVGVTILKDQPFANMDVADVISLLVTGYPHNYENFVINSRSVGTFTPGKGNSAETFFNSLQDITRSTNRALGNFEPAKLIQIDRRQMAERTSLQTDIRSDSENLRKLQKDIASIQDNINLLKSGNNQDIENRGNILLNKLLKQLREKQRAFQESVYDAEDIGLRIYGNDIIIDSEDDSEQADEQAQAAKVRSKFLQTRPQLNTKLNTDSNLFIVSDDYDKDLDLQAFAVNLSSGEIPIWNSNYKHPKEICLNAAKVVDFEFFCDTQGHIRLQPPKYNKLPLSILAKMLLLSDKKGIDLMPPFVRALFMSRTTALSKRSETLDIEIEILSLLLFNKPRPPIDILNQGDAAFVFETTLLDRQDRQDQIDFVTTSLSSRAREVFNRRNDLADIAGTSPIPDTADAIRAIESEIAELNDPDSPNINTKRLTKINKLLQFSSRKQRVDETLGKIKDRQKDLMVTLKNVSSGFGASLQPGDLAELVQPFGDLIEDDFNDFLGPGSSQRFIIRDDQIISYDFKESDQNVFCRADVTGQLDLIGESPGQIGGVPMIWAGATDFDLWKQYGYRPGPTTNKPFFKDAETQCAPYALMLLTRQRRDTVRANLTLTGNEYYQLGDVVYINSRDMLYYVTGISHKFSYSGSFTTQLDLRYGHPVGEFIPTPLDIIGKNLIKNQRKFNTTFMDRVTVIPPYGRTTGAVIFNGNDSDNIKQKMLTGDIGVHNLSELKNAILRINSYIDRESFKQVEVRGFIKQSETRSLEDDRELVLARMNAVKEWLIRPISGYSDSGDEVTIDPVFKKIPPGKIKSFNDSDPVELDIDKDTGKLKNSDNIGRTPSEDVYNVLQDPATQIQNVIEIVLVFNED